MEGEPIQKFYSKHKHPNDMKYGKRPRQRPALCFICHDLYCKVAWGDDTPIPGSGLAGSWKKTKNLGRKEENTFKRNLAVLINQEIQLRNETED